MRILFGRDGDCMSVRWSSCILFCGVWSGDIHCRIVDSSYGMFTNWSGGSPFSVTQRSSKLTTRSAYMTRSCTCIATTHRDVLSPVSLAIFRLINSRWELTRICQRFGFLLASTPLSLPKSTPALGFGSSIVSTVTQVAISL